MAQINETVERWRSVVSEYDRRTVTAKEFCKENQVSYHQIVYWRRKLLGVGKKKSCRNNFVKINPEALNLSEEPEFKKESREILQISIVDNQLKFRLNLPWDL